MVMAQSLFIALKHRHPKVSLSVLAPAWTQPLLARMPEVNHSFSMPVGHGKLGFSDRWGLGRELKQHNTHQDSLNQSDPDKIGFDQAIVLPSSLKAALVPLFAGIPIRTGFVGEQRYGLLNDIRKLNKTQLPLNVQRFVALSEDANKHNSSTYCAPSFDNPALSIDPKAQKAALTRLNLSSQHKTLVLCPGAEYGPAKQWPTRHFADLAKQYAKQNGQVWILGSKKDRIVAQEINQLSGDVCTILAGETSLGEVVDLMACANAVVSNDSGLMHIAAALNLNLVALYGSSSPDFTPPLSGRAKALNTDIGCRPCFKRVCPLGHTDCLEQLSVERVLVSLMDSNRSTDTLS